MGNALDGPSLQSEKIRVIIMFVSVPLWIGRREVKTAIFHRHMPREVDIKRHFDLNVPRNVSPYPSFILWASHIRGKKYAKMTRVGKRLIEQ